MTSLEDELSRALLGMLPGQVRFRWSVSDHESPPIVSVWARFGHAAGVCSISEPTYNRLPAKHRSRGSNELRGHARDHRRSPRNRAGTGYRQR
jgi:hypothetical protein